jgi:tetratricopeptide (TPR) repeat protein
MLAVAALVALTPAASGQFIKFNFGQKPTVPVTIKHPPTLGITLAGKKVAFGQIASGCAQQFADLVMQDFVSQGVTLVNRGDLDAILAEHNFQVGGSVDPATAVQLGKVLGPAIMVFLNVSRCEARKDGPLYENQPTGARVNISRTEAHFLASIHTVDLATGRELAVNSVRADPQRDNRAQAPAIPEYPNDYELQDAALRAAAAQAHRLYFPWVETRDVSFMNNKECNLKQAYELLKTGDIDAVLKLSQENVNACKSDPKPTHQADALYNLGVAYMLSGDYDNALATLTESQRVHADKATVEAIAQCRAAKDAAAASAASEARAANEQKAEQASQQQRDEQAAKSVLTNDSVIKLVKGGLSDEVVVRMIAAQPAKFSLSPDDLLALKQAGVSDKVIAAMLDKK